MSEADWTDLENDALVADYFAMLQKELAGERYNKAAHNRALQAIIGRSKGSIEFKHQNVSAVLQGLGEVWIQGYKPKCNFQDALVDAVVRWSRSHQDWMDRKPPKRTGLNEVQGLWLEPAPALKNEPPPKDLEKLLGIARKFNVPERDERNRALGEAGEQLVLNFETHNLRSAGRSDLAKQVRWVSKLDGDGAGYDIASFLPDGTSRLIEVKTTKGWERTPFYISKNELDVSCLHKEHWYLFRLWNFERSPRAFELRPPLEHHVELSAYSYRASFERHN